MGSGKTTVANLLHPRLKKTAHIGTDRIKWFVSDFKRTKKDNEIARRVLIAMCEEYLRNGISLLLAQGFVTSSGRKPYIALARRMKVRLFQYRLYAPRKILLERLAIRPKASLAKTPVPKTRILRNLKLHNAHKYRGATIIDTSCTTPAEAADRIYKDITS